MSEQVQSVSAVATSLCKLSVEEIDAKVAALESEIRALKVLRTAVKASAGKRKRKAKKAPAEQPSA